MAATTDHEHVLARFDAGREENESESFAPSLLTARCSLAAIGGDRAGREINVMPQLDIATGGGVDNVVKRRLLRDLWRLVGVDGVGNVNAGADDETGYEDSDVAANAKGSADQGAVRGGGGSGGGGDDVATARIAKVAHHACRAALRGDGGGNGSGRSAAERRATRCAAALQQHAHARARAERGGFEPLWPTAHDCAAARAEGWRRRGGGKDSGRPDTGSPTSVSEPDRALCLFEMEMSRHVALRNNSDSSASSS